MIYLFHFHINHYGMPLSNNKFNIYSNSIFVSSLFIRVPCVDVLMNEPFITLINIMRPIFFFVKLML